jgi:hypothetical protein
MSEETKPFNPANMHLPRDYEEDFEYRQPKPIISSKDTSDDEEKNRSGETTPVNNTTSDKPIPPNPFALLTNLVDMANQGTGGNAKQIGNGTNSIPLAPNIADVVDQLADLTVDSQKASYLAPDDIVKKYKELEVQYHRDKINNGKIICAILDLVKTLKDLPQEFEQFVEEIKKDEKQVTQLCNFQELSLSKVKEISKLYSQQSSTPLL